MHPDQLTKLKSQWSVEVAFPITQNLSIRKDIRKFKEIKSGLLNLVFRRPLLLNPLGQTH